MRHHLVALLSVFGTILLCVTGAVLFVRFRGAFEGDAIPDRPTLDELYDFYDKDGA